MGRAVLALPLLLAPVGGAWRQNRALEQAERWCERYAGGTAAPAPRPSRVDEAAGGTCTVADGFETYVYDLEARR